MAVDVVQAMDMNQAVQTIKWLDEERRKDKVVIATLQERIQAQNQKIAQQENQVQELMTTVAGIQGVIGRIDAFAEIVDTYKSELLIQMDQRDETRRKEQAESERLRRIEYEALTDHLHRLDRELQVLPRYDEQLTALRTEDHRLSEGVQRASDLATDLAKRSDERVQAVAYLEEQRRADNRRIVEVERDLPPLFKRIEALAQKLPLLEESLQKQRARVDEVVRESDKYDKPIEELRVSDFQREQKMKQYLDQGEAVAKELERIREQTQGFLEQQQMVKRSLRSLDPFAARLEKRQNEVTEMQRLAEERLRKQWEEWEVDQVQQRKKWETLIEERWRRQETINDDLKKRLDVIPPVLELHQTQLNALWDVRRDDATQLLAAAQSVYDAIIAPVDGQLALLRGEKPKSGK
jgi:hypothetical protein